MRKPPNYDSTTIMRIPPEAGGYVMTIINAFKDISKHDKPYIKFYMDIAEGLFKDYYNYKYIEERQRTDKPIWRCYYCLFLNNPISVQDAKFAFEDSNYRFKFDSAIDDPKQFVGLKVGALLNKVVFMSANKKHKYIKILPESLCPVSKIENGEFIIGAFQNEITRQRNLNKAKNKDRWEE